ncbi:predicted protein [Methanosarcina acetivorans C2A]|uniref:Uncharacterized protein n=1 Tax=Methanosarcina acetivorans (strain ATCC 35395 / DSM 2834 / JCM 12185 / C2A) TaxID=188937 RepID=Q8TNQ6_METAC|nr:predicted protein [Methanosarcina acetivorans C2A]
MDYPKKIFLKNFTALFCFTLRKGLPGKGGPNLRKAEPGRSGMPRSSRLSACHAYRFYAYKGWGAEPGEDKRKLRIISSFFLIIELIPKPILFPNS